MFCATAALLFFLHLGFVEINRDIKATFCLFQGIFSPKPPDFDYSEMFFLV